MIGVTPLFATSAAAIRDIWVAPLKNGAICVLPPTTADAPTLTYVLDKVNGNAHNGTTVIAPNSGAPIAGAATARWVLCCTANGE